MKNSKRNTDPCASAFICGFIALCFVGFHLAGDDLLPNTQPLTLQGEVPSMLLYGAHRFVERKIDESIAVRQKRWHRDFTSREAYEKSVAENRAHFRKIIGVVDDRLPPQLEKFGDASEDRPSLVAETNLHRVYQ